MDTIQTLFWADSIAFTRWITQKSVSRLIVALLFFVVFGAVTYGVYLVSSAFFRSLVLYEQYGQMTGSYILHASIIVIFWLAFCSSVASVTGMLLSSSPNFSYLLALPLPSRVMNYWLYGKGVIANYLLMIFAFLPIAAAYGNAFGLWDPYFFFRVLFVLLCIVGISTAIGMVIGLEGLTWLRGKEYPAAVLGMVIFFTAMIGILRFIFPPELSRLYDLSSSMFLPLYNSLPLNNPMLPTFWLVQTVTEGFNIMTVFVLFLSAAIIIVCLEFQRSRLVQVLLRLKSSPYAAKTSKAGFYLFGTTRDPLVLKDWYSIVRLPSEKGYGLFLGSIAIFFFLMISLGIGRDLRQGVWNNSLNIFSFAWLGFFASAYFLRFLFPLMAREGHSAWYLFTLPITRSRILSSKVWLGVIIAIPVLVFAVIVWFLLPFAAANRAQLIGISLVFIIVLAISHILFGAILPNFLVGNDPEKVSTSGMGLLTILSSGLLVALMVYLIQFMLTGISEGIFTIVYFCLFGVLCLYLLRMLVKASMKRWEW